MEQSLLPSEDKLVLRANLNEKQINFDYRKKLSPIQLEKLYISEMLYHKIANRKTVLSEVQDLVKKGADVNFKYKAIGMPLTMALRNKYNDIAQFLVQQGAQVDPSTELVHGKPLAIAIKTGNAPMVQFLLEHGAKVNDLDYKGTYIIDFIQQESQAASAKKNDVLAEEIYSLIEIITDYHQLLFKAIDDLDVERVEKFIDQGLNSNYFDNVSGSTPITYTMRRFVEDEQGRNLDKDLEKKYETIITVLVDNGADIYSVDAFGLSAVDYVGQYVSDENRKSLLKILLKPSKGEFEKRAAQSSMRKVHKELKERELLNKTKVEREIEQEAQRQLLELMSRQK